jgi:hypothetical protein
MGVILPTGAIHRTWLLELCIYDIVIIPYYTYNIPNQFVSLTIMSRLLPKFLYWNILELPVHC